MPVAFSAILPLFLDGAVVRHNAVFFEQARFSGSGAGSSVRGYPEVAPSAIFAPCFFISLYSVQCSGLKQEKE
ncbi:hypothetical protein BDW66DRAFT_146475 [Aspergillus desertorum]